MWPFHISLVALSLFCVILCQSVHLEELLALNYSSSSGDSLALVEAQIDSLIPETSELNGCNYACALLSALAPGSVAAPGEAGYQPLAYWSAQQAAVIPACRIDVESSLSIAKAILVSRLTECPFAVKSGGHTAFAGGSSIQDGILINLAPLKTVKLSDDRSTTRVGPGNTWYDVYTKLDPQNVSVVGGREAGVGVGGLILGGGISYFSGRYGWACDNVCSYEVVLANGSIVHASNSSHPDLYWALRGGSGTNFGIVSQFELATFEQGLLWGGSRIYPISTNASLADAFANFTRAAPTDPFAHLYIGFLYVVATGDYVGFSGPVYGKPVANPEIFDELTSIPNIEDLTSVANMSRLSVELNQTSYLRETWKTATFKNDATLIKDIFNIFIEILNPILNVPGLIPALAFQPLSLNIMEQMSKNGGNVLGLEPEDGPLMIMNLNFGWSNEGDDAAIFNATNTFVERSIALAKSRGLYNRFIYMNYATLDEDVFGGYGAENEARLRKVRDMYDPDKVFARLQPGYFKLPIN